jgi:hypothetical protein
VVGRGDVGINFNGQRQDNNNYLLDVTDIENPSCGQITNTVGNPRLMQISLRYAF